MSSDTYYLKYRPQKVSELDSSAVRESLGKIVSSGKLPHALLFAGPKGTGKTSAARIIAKVVNCEKNLKKLSEPCNKCKQCLGVVSGSNLDVIELDAASHRGIDDVRALRDAVKLAPASAKRKVYIIDEAHMLTTEASNALLKTLEEPPAHVLFILATTNPEKLLPTILSRVTTVYFTKADKEELTNSLIKIAKGEKLKVDKETLGIIAQKSDGSFRDAAKILEQLVSEKRPLKKDSVEEFLLRSKSFDEEEFVSLLIARDTKPLIEKVEAFVEGGIEMDMVIARLIERFRKALIAEVGAGTEKLQGMTKDDLVLLLKLLIRAKEELKNAYLEQLPLELAVIEWGRDVKEGEAKPEKEGEKGKEVAEKKEGLPPESVKRANPRIKEVSEDVWKTILSQVKPVNTSIEALLRAARPIDFDGKTLTLGVYYRFHKERLEEGTHRRILEDVIAIVLGAPVRVVCTLSEPPVKRVVVEKKEETVLTEGGDEDIIKVAEEIFGN